MPQFDHFQESWKSSILKRKSTARDEFPEYPSSDPKVLITTSRIHSFELGTSASIYTHSLLPGILQAEHEIIIVTCFWSGSSTRIALKEALETMAAQRRALVLKAREPGSVTQAPPLLRVRICFSSRSFFQKIFHTWSKDGYVYPPSQWTSRLGMPSQKVLEAGLIDLRIKSIFFLPFSVLHSKYVVVDRQRAWLPSCNVSWEAWLECCVEITGDGVAGLIKFHKNVWDPELENQIIPRDGPDLGSATASGSPRITVNPVPSFVDRFLSLPEVVTPTILLPSSHHRNPDFTVMPCSSPATAPPTPLNCAILRLLDMAENYIYFQTPNITSPDVIDGILEVVKRGVDVAIVTSKGLMRLEQLITSGTTTARCLKLLVRKYRKLQAGHARPRHIPGRHDSAVDVEAQQRPLGSLKIWYFRPRPDPPPESKTQEPQKTHIKLTIVDGQYTVLGSGNMDRASWFTSQELGMLSYSVDFATAVNAAVAEVLADRLEPVFLSTTDE
ncbi:hypothetical protein GGR53DRAFT_462867 [Hypoxylon sp. FL1150]|nr:hypothetical protein GGR53DRAFT_462867 [Hypoxylon sp. FL1150]